jgi:hypothetical protein
MLRHVVVVVVMLFAASARAADDGEGAERRRLLDSLRQKGVPFGGQDKMRVDELRELEKVMSSIGGSKGGFKMPGNLRTPGDGGGVGKKDEL